MQSALKNESVLRALQEIVGSEYVSDHPEELYLYSRAPSGVRTGKPDFLVLPKTAKEISAIVRLARAEQIPIVPWGGGLSLSDLTIPLRGGIVLDMNRMDSIIEVNAESRYAVVEAGVTVGRLVGYLKQHHPSVRISVPDAPPAATMCGNAVIFGSGHLSKYGAHSEMVMGLEAVLPDGEICKIGHFAFSGNEQSLEGHPELRCLFTNWFGATGVITKLCLALYPAHPIREVVIFKIENPKSIPSAIARMTETGLAEDVLIFAMKQKESRIPMTLLQTFVTADAEAEMEEKKEIIRKLFDDCTVRGEKILPVADNLFPKEFMDNLMDEPKRGIEESVDAKKGGGSAYVGACFPLESIPAAYKMGLSISEKYGFTGPLYTIRNIGVGHSVIFTFMYPFNRIDEESIETMKKASDEAAMGIRELGGVVWKPSIKKQNFLFEIMTPGTRDLIGRVKHAVDPLCIFNPGNWDPKEEAPFGEADEEAAGHCLSFSEDEKIRQIYPQNAEEISAVFTRAPKSGCKVCWRTGDDKNRPREDCVIVNTRDMSKIISVNSTSRYALLEPGVTFEKLDNYLNEHCPDMEHGLESTSSSECIIDSILTHGKHAVQTLYGTADNMIQGIEVVLPDGVVSRQGSCSTSSLWFSNGPAPDLQKLFLTPNRALGIITKFALRLFPRPKYAETVIYTLKNAALLPEMIERVAHTETADRITVVSKESPSYMKGVIIVALRITARDNKSLIFKKSVFKNLFSRKEALFKDGLRSDMLEAICKPVERPVAFFTSLQSMPVLLKKCADLVHANKGKFIGNFSILDHGRKVLGELSCELSGDRTMDALFEPLKNTVRELGGTPQPFEQPFTGSASDNLLDAVGRAIDKKHTMIG